MHLGICEHLIPPGALRSRLAELPADKNAEIICFCEISLRGYEAESILRAYGLLRDRTLPSNTQGKWLKRNMVAATLQWAESKAASLAVEDLPARSGGALMRIGPETVHMSSYFNG